MEPGPRCYQSLGQLYQVLCWIEVCTVSTIANMKLTYTVIPNLLTLLELCMETRYPKQYNITSKYNYVSTCVLCRENVNYSTGTNQSLNRQPNIK